ncbi:MAG: TolC family protein [Bacteroidales bacterium]|nr:TolC family protein [Bacteroidales bacterium]
MKRIFLLILTFSFAVIDVDAQQKLPLDSCVSMALTQNKLMAKAEKTYSKQDAQAEAYKTNRLPKFSLIGGAVFTSDAKMEYNVPEGYLPTFSPDPATGALKPNVIAQGADGSPIFSNYAFFPGMDLSLDLGKIIMGGISVQQPIYMGGKIETAVRMSQTGKEMADLNRNLVRSEVILNTNEAYYKLVEVLELQKAAESYRDVVSELYRNVQNAYEIGMRPQNDVLKVRSKLNEAELKVRQAQNGVKVAKMNLCHCMGLPLDTDILPADSVIVDQIDDLPPIDVSSRTETSLLDKKISLKDSEIKLTESDFRPQVAVIGAANYIWGPELNDEQLFNDVKFSAALTVNVPLFHWGEGKKKSSAIRFEKEELELEKADLTEKMQMELALALNAYDEALLEVQLTKTSLDQAAENMRVAKDMYDIGEETLAGYLESQTVWTKANTDYVTAKGKFQVAKVKVMKAAGRM